MVELPSFVNPSDKIKRLMLSLQKKGSLRPSQWDKLGEPYHKLYLRCGAGVPGPGSPDAALRSFRHSVKQNLWKPYGFPRRFEPLPTLRVEKARCIKRKAVPRFKYSVPGEYVVLPDRKSLQNIEDMFWTKRFILDSLKDINNLSGRVDYSVTIRYLKSLCLKYLGNGTKKITSFQRKVLAPLSYSLRRCRKTALAVGPSSKEQKIDSPLVRPIV